MKKTLTISRADLKAKRYRKTDKDIIGDSPSKRDVELIAEILKKVKI